MTKKTRQQSAKAIAEFVNEAQDILESLGKDLMTIDRTPVGQEKDPDLVNNLFRGVHTLKSLSGMFGVECLSDLSHQEENLLEEIRLGRIDFSPEILNLLFESLDVMTRILAAVSQTGSADEPGLIKITHGFMAKLSAATGEDPSEENKDATPSQDPMELLGQDVLEVLTEYEEHRLKTNLEKGLAVYRIGMRFDLDSIDVKLEEVRSRLKETGEIITYLPSSDESDQEKLGIDLILVLAQSREVLGHALGEMEAKIREVVPATQDGDEPRSATLPPSIAPPSEVPESAASGATEQGSGPIVADQRHKVSGIAPPSPEDQAISLRSANQSVRVDIKKLDSLMNVVGELGVVRTAIAKMSERVSQILGQSDLTIELDQMNRGLDRRLAALRDGILEVRMVPLGAMFDRLARMVRRVSTGLKKEIHFVISGSDTEVDKLITEELSNPLMHLIRNAIDHGVESAEEREAIGKPEFGTVALTAYQKGSHVVIEVEDDGAGIDGQRLLDAAVERGILEEAHAESLSEREINNLIFVPGVSTSEETTEISGRGVGMDVVKTNVASLGGVIEVQSERFIGTKFTVTLPVTLATIPGLLVSIGEKTYAIPLNTVAEAIFVATKDIRTMLGNETVSLRGETLVLCRLKEFFGLPREDEEKAELCVVVATLGQQRIGLVVDALQSQQDVVVKPLGRTLKDQTCFSGATDVGEERLALVIDPSQVIDAFFSHKDGLELRAQFGSQS